MNKELLLIFEFDSAPTELKTTAENLRDTLRQLSKKSLALEDSRNEVAELERKKSQLEREFQTLLRKWDPETTKAEVKAKV